jgi:large exoprotein involved in heme utilization and adhesion
LDTDPNGNSFVITGRGGLPDSPYEPFKDRSLWVDLRSLGKNQPSQQQSRTKISTPNIQSNLDRSEPEALV